MDGENQQTLHSVTHNREKDFPSGFNDFRGPRPEEKANYQNRIPIGLGFPSRILLRETTNAGNVYFQKVYTTCGVNSSPPHSHPHFSANSNTVLAFHRTGTGKDISDTGVASWQWKPRLLHEKFSREEGCGRARSYPIVLCNGI
ncbi:uncharacterized protein PADG_11762 [Paracoccidioides brasiliensis Pb18]|uniref:Uncharacterized protein n=1 Tax=Paracoccidioides brasiliensis (strain Pb18) TaxID=502780 RepID=A0A0A0HST1_PARBD|nr:uncharacterized protein PADG_11762 [Paracoccidioides brasiliensis Pb18]KGM92224.1 hypothetical protein PADG_11762 [Paracoccidioides brasiliensis Pb18]